MSGGPGQSDDAEVAIIFARLREEVRRREDAEGAANESLPADRPLAARGEAQRYWAVTAERSYLYRPGWSGRVRGLALLPLKAVMRRLMRWYVEPLALDQRAFNAAVLRLVDELAERAAALDRRLARLESEDSPAPKQ